MSYGARNVSYGAAHPDLSFRRAPFVPFHRLGFLSPTARYRTVAFPLAGVDLVHLYNDVCRSTRPWVASFEHLFPMEDASASRRVGAIRLAAGPRCRAILAISDHARRRLRADPQAGAALGSKCELVYPCVPREDDLYGRHVEWLAANRPGGAPVEVLFVGNEFFRKGGEFVVEALEGFPARLGVPIRLTVVSTLSSDSYLTRADPARVRRAAERLAAMPNVERLENVTPREVRERMARAHLLLHPSLDETFGFVLAEALATGLDVVTANLRVVPEILPPDLLPEAIALPQSSVEEWVGARLGGVGPEGDGRRAWEDARERCVEAIRARLARIVAEPDLLARRASPLRARYLERFTPEGLGTRLFDVYSRALSSR